STVGGRWNEKIARAGCFFGLGISRRPFANFCLGRLAVPDYQKPQESARGRKPFRALIVPGGVYGGGARRPRAERETGRSKPNEAVSAASELASAVVRPC